MESLAGLHASVSSVILGSASANSRLLSQSKCSCCGPQTPLPHQTEWMFHLPLSLPPSWVLPLCPPGCFPGPAFPVVVPRCPACLVLPTRSPMMGFPFLVCMSLFPHGLLLVMLLPHLPTVMMKFPCHGSHIVLLWFHVVMLGFLSCAPTFLAAAPPLPLLVRPRYTLQNATNAVSGMVNTVLVSTFFFLVRCLVSLVLRPHLQAPYPWRPTHTEAGT
jgi:hypothetical protein